MLVKGTSFTPVLLVHVLVLLVVNMHWSLARQMPESGGESVDGLLPVSKVKVRQVKVWDKASDKASRQFLKAFESRLFGLFGLKSRPKPKKQMKIPDYMVQLYEQQQQLNQQTSDDIDYIDSDDSNNSDEELTSDVFNHNKRSTPKQSHKSYRSHYNKRFSLSGNANTIISHKQHYEGMRPQTHLSCEPVLGSARAACPLPLQCLSCLHLVTSPH